MLAFNEQGGCPAVRAFAGGRLEDCLGRVGEAQTPEDQLGCTCLRTGIDGYRLETDCLSSRSQATGRLMETLKEHGPIRPELRASDQLAETIRSILTQVLSSIKAGRMRRALVCDGEMSVMLRPG